ncbi:MAG TPA: type I-U CRISPR-associated RAMP protein Csb1/Cas7u [Gemmataceae bacterium]
MRDYPPFDAWLDDTGPAALVIREHLMPVEGLDGVVFPATYAPTQASDDQVTKEQILVSAKVEDKKAELSWKKQRFGGGYNIDYFDDGSNVCLIDSVGSQANRIEPIFTNPPYADLVPQIVINVGRKSVNLLEAGHRAGDAIARCSELKNKLQAAFREVLKGNVEELAKIAPTSLVFGVWDSRGTQAKLPRLVSSTIRAFNVRRLTRSANYLVQQQLDYIKDEIMPQWDLLTETEKEKLSEKGFLNALASATHGGVIALGGIRRDATLSLAALRLLTAREADGAIATVRTTALRRYILGLALIAITAPQSAYLRQGCQLVPDPAKPREFKLVQANGRREDFSLPNEEPFTFAKAATDDFKVHPSGTYSFVPELAEQERTEASAKMKGEITTIDVVAKKFTLKPGKKKPEVEVTTTDATVYLKGKSDSTFEAVVVAKAKVQVELANGVAVKVTGK